MHTLNLFIIRKPREMTEKNDWRAKQPPRKVCISEDLKCWGAWDITCWHKAWWIEAWEEIFLEGIRENHRYWIGQTLDLFQSPFGETSERSMEVECVSIFLSAWIPSWTEPNCKPVISKPHVLLATSPSHRQCLSFPNAFWNSSLGSCFAKWSKL